MASRTEKDCELGMDYRTEKDCELEVDYIIEHLIEFQDDKDTFLSLLKKGDFLSKGAMYGDLFGYVITKLIKTGNVKILSLMHDFGVIFESPFRDNTYAMIAISRDDHEMVGFLCKAKFNFKPRDGVHQKFPQFIYGNDIRDNQVIQSLSPIWQMIRKFDCKCLHAYLAAGGNPNLTTYQQSVQPIFVSTPVSRPVYPWEIAMMYDNRKALVLLLMYNEGVITDSALCSMVVKCRNDDQVRIILTFFDNLEHLSPDAARNLFLYFQQVFMEVYPCLSTDAVSRVCTLLFDGSFTQNKEALANLTLVYENSPAPLADRLRRMQDFKKKKQEFIQQIKESFT